MVKKGFGLIEILVAMLMLSVLVVVSIKSIKLLNQNSNLIEIRYLALNRLDIELNRLVYTYATKLPITNYVSSDIDSTDKDEPFVVTQAVNNFKIYEIEPIADTDTTYGLKVTKDTSTATNNIVEIKNIPNNEFNTVDDGDVVGLLGWRSVKIGQNEEIALSLTYPYIYDNNILKQMYDFVETITLKTAVRKP